MENVIKKECELITKTEKAVLLKIDNKKYWFPKSKVTLLDNFVEMEQQFFDKAEEVFVKEELVEVFLPVEDYSEKVFKLVVPIKRETYEVGKFVFIPKSVVKEIKSDSFIVPKWIWDRSIEEMLDKEVEYFKKTYETDITTNEYELLLEVVDL